MAKEKKKRGIFPRREKKLNQYEGWQQELEKVEVWLQDRIAAMKVVGRYYKQQVIWAWSSLLLLAGLAYGLVRYKEVIYGQLLDWAPTIPRDLIENTLIVIGALWVGYVVIKYWPTLIRARVKKMTRKLEELQEIKEEMEKLEYYLKEYCGNDAPPCDGTFFLGGKNSGRGFQDKVIPTAESIAHVRKELDKDRYEILPKKWRRLLRRIKRMSVRVPARATTAFRNATDDKAISGGLVPLKVALENGKETLGRTLQDRLNDPEPFMGRAGNKPGPGEWASEMSDGDKAPPLDITSIEEVPEESPAGTEDPHPRGESEAKKGE